MKENEKDKIRGIKAWLISVEWLVGSTKIVSENNLAGAHTTHLILLTSSRTSSLISLAMRLPSMVTAVPLVAGGSKGGGRMGPGPIAVELRTETI